MMQAQRVGKIEFPQGFNPVLPADTRMVQVIHSPPSRMSIAVSTNGDGWKALAEWER